MTDHSNLAAELAKNKRGIAYIVCALAVLILLDTCSKFAVQRIPVTFAAWSRYAGHMFLVFIFAYPRVRNSLWKTQSLKVQILRGLMLATMSIFYFAAVKTLPLAHATALLFLTPILITVWAKLFLGEAVSRGGWLAVLVGFIGVLIICRPRGGLDGQGVAFALCAALANSFYQTLTRRTATDDAPETQLFYTGLVGAVALSASMPAWWTPLPADISTAQWLAFGLLGVFGAAGHFLLIKAYQAASASTLAPWMYMQMVLALALGWLVFGDKPDLIAVLGMILIALAPRISTFKFLK
jgi:drug/metabolite transporter (DMT)-like permease